MKNIITFCICSLILFSNCDKENEIPDENYVHSDNFPIEVTNDVENFISDKSISTGFIISEPPMSNEYQNFNDSLLFQTIADNLTKNNYPSPEETASELINDATIQVVTGNNPLMMEKVISILNNFSQTSKTISELELVWDVNLAVTSFLII